MKLREICKCHSVSLRKRFGFLSRPKEDPKSQNKHWEHVFEQSGWMLGGQTYRSKWLVKQELRRVLDERKNEAKGQRNKKYGGKWEAFWVAGPGGFWWQALIHLLSQLKSTWWKFLLYLLLPHLATTLFYNKKINIISSLSFSAGCESFIC